MLVDQEYLKELLHYDPAVGKFTWIKSRRNVVFGSIAGHIHKSGYIIITINTKKYRAHRLVFLYMTGSFPKDQVDHINQDGCDNRWKNLRECSQHENQGNRPLNKNNKSGYKGVCWHKKLKKWTAQINTKEPIHLGSFNCRHEAAGAYNDAALKHFGEFACLNKIGE